MPTRQTTPLSTIQFPVADGNWDANRGPIHSIVLHTMVGTVEGANGRFNTPGVQVSAHYGVGLDGKLYQWVDEDNVAYHAGNYLVNQSSIGIEHEDGGDYNGIRPDVLYETSAKLVADICKFYDFPADGEHIFKHKNVSDNPTSCPDALDTDRIIVMAQEILNPTPVVEPTPQIQTPPPTPEPFAVPETPQLHQTDTNPVNNTPDQTSTPPVEVAPAVSGQAGKVPLVIDNTISVSWQSKLKIPNWIKDLIINFLSLIGIERKKS